MRYRIKYLKSWILDHRYSKSHNQRLNIKPQGTGFTLYFRGEQGFTLIELLIVISILTILITTTIVVVNPGMQFAKANNLKRNSDINVLLSAIGQYASDNKGSLPTGITTTPQVISSTGADICSALIAQYMASLPVDPLTNSGTPISNCAASYTTNYTVVKSETDNRITVSAPDTQIPPGIEILSITR